MRIWMITRELPHASAAGIARYVGHFSKLAASNGHEVVVIGRSNTRTAVDEEIQPGLRHIGFVPQYELLSDSCDSDEPDAHPGYPYNVLSYSPALSYQLSEVVLDLLERLPKPDVIESQEYSGLPYFLLQRKLVEDLPLKDIPILVHLHGPLYELMKVNQEPRFKLPEYWIGEMEKASTIMADAILGPSRFVAERAKETLGNSLSIEHIVHALDSENQRAPGSGTPNEVVFVGRLLVLKGVPKLVAACEHMWNAGRDFRLTLIGDDADFHAKGTTVRTYIEDRYAKWIANGNLNLAGPLPYEELLDRLHNAWVAVVPSLWENFPFACIEPMLVGQLVLGASYGGHVEMIGTDGRNGVLFDWEKPGDFEQKLGEILDMPPERRLEMAQNGHNRIVELCNPQRVLQERIAHFERIIGEYKPPQKFPALPNVIAKRPTPNITCESDLLSVVVPFFNLGGFVEATINSIEQSTYKDTEIIIVNDGSTEPASLESLERIKAKQLSHVRIIDKANEGLAAARNTGADEARGEYILFLDADDTVEPTYFEHAINVLKRYDNVDFVYPWLRYFDGNKGFWITWNAQPPYLLGHNICCVMAIMRKSAFMAHGRNKPAIEYAMEDYEMWLSMTLAGCVGVSIPKPLGNYRIRSQSMWQSSNALQHVYLYDLISNLHPEAYQHFGMELFNLQNANGPARLWDQPGSNTLADAERGSDINTEQQKTIQQQHERIVELEDLVSRLWDELQQFRQSWESQKECIENQNREIEDHKKRESESLDHIKQVEATIDQLRQELQNLKNSWIDKNNQIDEQQNRISELDDMIAELTQFKNTASKIFGTRTFKTLQKLRLLPEKPTDKTE